MGPFQEHRLSEAGVRLVHYADPLKNQSELAKILNKLAGNDDSPPSSMATREASSLCPFPGLEFFDRNRAAMFFGRESEISEAAQRLGQTAGGRHVRWLQIEGPSGAGKSSLARAGLIPAVLEKNEWVRGVPRLWRVAVFRPGVDPVMSLAHAVRAALAEELGDRHPLGEIVAAFRARPEELAAFLRQHTPADHGFLLVVDQLEEAFTFGAEDPKKAFDELMASAVRDKGGPLYVISTIRSDFVGKMSALPELEGLLNAEAERYHLKTMSAPGMRAAMVEPAKLAGLRWEKNLPERLLKDASRSEGGLPLLAHALQALWVAREGNALTHAAYGELGEIGGALSRSADAILKSLGKNGRKRAKRLLLRLVKIGRGAEDTRRTATHEEAIEAAGGGVGAERVLGRLSGQRDRDKPEGALAEARLLVVAQGDGEEARVDLVHEALLRRWKKLRGWIKEGRKALERRDDLEAAAQVWQAGGSSADGLPGGSQLAYLRGAEAPGKLAQQFLDAAIAKEKKGIRRLKAIVATLSVGVVAVSGLAVFAGVQRSRAEQRLTDAIELANQVVTVINGKLAVVPGAAGVRKDLLDQASKLQDRLIAGAGDSNEALRSRMAAHIQRGDLARTHDNLALARQEYDAGLALANKLTEIDSQDANAQRTVCVSYYNLGDVAQAGGDPTAARGFFDKALELTKALAARDPHNAVFQRDLALGYQRLGDAARIGGDPAAARGFFDKALELTKALVAEDPHNVVYRRDLALSYDKLGVLARARDDLTEARGFFDKQLELIKALAAEDPYNADVKLDLAASYHELGEVAQTGSDLSAARGFFDKALELRKVLAETDAHNGYLILCLAANYRKLGEVVQAGGDLSAARGFFDKALELFTVLVSADADNAAFKIDLAVTYQKLGEMVQAGGDLSAARGFFDKSLELFTALIAAAPHNNALQRELAVSYAKLGDVMQDGGDLSAARGFFDKALDLFNALAVADPHNAALQRDLYVTYIARESSAPDIGDLRAAGALFATSLAPLTSLAEANPHDAALQRALSHSYGKVGEVAQAGGDLSAARLFFDKALELCKALAATDPHNADLQIDLAMSYAELSDLALKTKDSAGSTVHQQAATAILNQLDRDDLGKGNAIVAKLRARLASLHK
jgi:tetratricopeptide (TPR) repeat protein